MDEADIGEAHRSSTILIVEDDPDAVHLLELFFQTSGFSNVHSTSDARDVEGLVQDLAPDLILMDLHMPHVDGLEVMRRVRQTVPGHAIPTIVMSGDITPRTRQLGREVGATDFLSKPYQMRMLLHKVAQALEASGAPAKSD